MPQWECDSVALLPAPASAFLWINEALKLHTTGTEQSMLPFWLWCLNYRESSQDVLKFNLTRNVKYISVFILWEGSILHCTVSLPRVLLKWFVIEHQRPNSCISVFFFFFLIKKMSLHWPKFHGEKNNLDNIVLFIWQWKDIVPLFYYLFWETKLTCSQDYIKQRLYNPPPMTRQINDPLYVRIDK